MDLHLPTFEELKSFVKGVLCCHADLDLATPLLETDLYRRGAPCGIEYMLLAPRSIRLSAIWEASANRIFFYDQKLERFQVTPISGPSLADFNSRPKENVAVKSIWRGK